MLRHHLDNSKRILNRLASIAIKRKALRACCAELVARYGGEVPSNMAALVQLPGVGRKTANVILGNAYEMAEGIVVDTHVRRLAGRLGLRRTPIPIKSNRTFSRWYRNRTGSLSDICSSCMADGFVRPGHRSARCVQSMTSVPQSRVPPHLFLPK